MADRNQPIVVPEPGGLVVAPLSQAKKHKRRFDAVLTIEDPLARQSDRLRFTGPTTTDHMVLKFEDADSERLGYATATGEQVRDAIAFGREHAGGTVLVHCLHGVGRSAACALAILADRMGPGREREALEALLTMRPSATPNLVVVSHADAILGSGGALVDAVASYEAASPEKTAARTRRAEFAEANPHLYAKRSHEAPGSIRNPVVAGRAGPVASLGKGPSDAPVGDRAIPRDVSAGR